MIRFPVKYYQDDPAKDFLGDVKITGKAYYLCLVPAPTSRETFYLGYANGWDSKMDLNTEPRDVDGWIWAKLETISGSTFIVPADGPADREFALTIMGIQTYV